MAHTPQTKGLSSLLGGINQGLNNLVRRGGPVLEDDSSVESEAPNLDVARYLSTNDKNGDVEVQDGGNPNISPASVPEPLSLIEGAAMEPPRKRAAAKVPQNRRKKKSNTGQQHRVLPTNNSNADPSHDPAVRRVVNPMRMTEAFDNGYDSDGWEGPNPKKRRRQQKLPLPLLLLRGELQ